MPILRALSRPGRFLFSAVPAVFFAVCLFAARAEARPSAEQERYYRAVYVLQCFGGPAAEEKVDIPPRVRRSDEAESLRFHSDRPLVLRRLAEDLAASAPRFPRARLFEAYARLSLGERRRAADLLNRYLSEAPYSARHYEILCRNLQALRDFSGLYLICREWEERDSVCRPERLMFAWTALLALGRHDDARRVMSVNAGCLVPEAAVYAAKAVDAAGNRKEAEGMVEAACRDFPTEAERLRAVWRRLLAAPVSGPEAKNGR